MARTTLLSLLWRATLTLPLIGPPLARYAHCPVEWLDAADDVDVDLLWPA